MSTWQLFSNDEVIDTKQLQTSNYEEAHTYFRLQKNLDSDVFNKLFIVKEYIKPKKGFMIIFPNWLQHCVMPFFGEGERRTMSANFNIRDSQKTVSQFKSPTLNKEH